MRQELFDKWDRDEGARREAGRKFHYYWQRLYWMRQHMVYLFGAMIGTTVILLIAPSDLVFYFVYIAGLVAIFSWIALQVYYALRMRQSYRRWGGFDGGGGRKNEIPPNGGQSPEVYGA